MAPTDITTPITADELGDALRAASAERRPVVPLGAGAHQHLGGPPAADALRLSTARLARVVEYAPADLTATVQAGATLANLQRELARSGQWLPWDPPGAASATVGGLLAAGASGPYRLGYGAPRDWVLGMRVALGDGRLVKSGGRVVKNVAGYDSHKLHIGALGTLGVIAEVTFKLLPRPELLASLAVVCADRAGALALAEQLRARPLSPVSLVVYGAHAGIAAPAAARPAAAGAHVVLARFAGVAPAVERQLAEAEARAARAGAPAERLPDAAPWDALVEFAAPRTGGPAQMVLRAGARPAALADLAAELDRQAPAGATAVYYPGVGLAYACWPADLRDPDGAAARLAALRSRLAAIGGYAVVEDTPDAVPLDRWGPPPEGFEIMRRLKQSWDPAGILNPGRYVGGL